MQFIKDYGGILFTIATMIFGFGAINSQLNTNTEAISKAQIYKERIIDLEKSINTMQLKVEAQHEWQGEFLISFKELIKELKDANTTLGMEIKEANHELGKEIQAINTAVIKNQYTIKSVAGSVEYNRIYERSQRSLHSNDYTVEPTR